MYVVFKIAVMICAFVFRVVRSRLPAMSFGDSRGHLANIDYSISVTKDDDGDVTSTTLRVPVTPEIVFKLTRESRFDKFMKSLGLANELQTNDPRFDQKIYVASDSYEFNERLASDSEARELVMKMFRPDCKYVSCDGSHMRAHLTGDHRNDYNSAKPFVEFSKRIEQLSPKTGGLLRDKFFVRVLFFEGMIWAVATYAFFGFHELVYFSDETYLDVYPVIQKSMMLGLVAAAILIFLIVLLLRGSSRGHRIIAESVVVLTLSLPLASAGLVTDLNVRFDTSESRWVDTTILRSFLKEHSGDDGKYYTYHLLVRAPEDTFGLDIPSELKVQKEVYDLATEGKIARLELGPGRLGHPWLRSIRIVEKSSP